MCLDKIWSRKEKKEWIGNQSDTITAYKVVLKNRAFVRGTSEEGESYSEFGKEYVKPMFYDGASAFKKTNKITKKPKRTSVEGRTYTPYYHICLTKEAAKHWKNGFKSRKILKCEVPRKAITAMGTQTGYVTIVTKEFTFIEGNKYFEKEKV